MGRVFNYLFLAVAIIMLYANISSAKEKDLRPLFEKYGIRVYDQGERGTCSVFAVTGLLEFEYAKYTGEFKPLSVEYLNWASNQITGEAEDGSYFSDAVKAVNKYGICENDLYPYYIQNYTVKVEPSAPAINDAKKRRTAKVIWIKDWDPGTGMDDGQVAQVKNQITDGHPVAIGFRWPKKDDRYLKTVNGMMVVPPEEGVFDGHSVILIGFEDETDAPGGGYFIFKNSHGEGYGEKGYGKMPYEYLLRYANDGIAIFID